VKETQRNSHALARHFGVIARAFIAHEGMLGVDLVP
jgi:hypothetical protein